MKTTNFVFIFLLSLAVYLPLLFPDFFLTPLHFPYEAYSLLRPALLMVPALAAFFCYFNEAGAPLKRLCTAIVLVLLAVYLESLHHQRVDLAFHYYSFFPRQFRIWQEQLHPEMIRLHGVDFPHNFRFLGDVLVAWLEPLSNDFQFAKEIYRVSTMILLLYAIFYFARFYLNRLGAWAAVAGYALVYPYSIRYYGGQLIDPISHLAFIAAYIFIRDRKSTYLALTIFYGVVAKESILAAALFNVIYSRRDRAELLRACGIFLLGLLPFFLIRLYFTGGTFSYQTLSGTPMDWIKINLHSNDWVNQNLIAMGIFLPFFALHFLRFDRFLRELILVVAPILFFSNVLFSWLYEVRNYIPATVPLIVATLIWARDTAMHWKEKLFGLESPGQKAV